MEKDPSPLPLISESDCNPVPVFSCHVILARIGDGQLSGRVANLDGIVVSGPSERDILKTIVRQFKAAIQQYSANGEEVPWLESPTPAAGEFERFIPVHL
ncbi:MAG: hypothetical protein P8K08_16835 [Fuerstiella sp.]|nr:hypothetical protein [Fuerstiella sp.]